MLQACFAVQVDCVSSEVTINPDRNRDCVQEHITRSLEMPELRFLLTGGIGAGEGPANPSKWLADRLWNEMHRLSGSFPAFEGFSEAFRREEVGRLFDSQTCILSAQWCLGMLSALGSFNSECGA